MAKIKLILPYNTAFSKNRAKTILGRGPRKFIGLTEEYRSLKEVYTMLIKDQLRVQPTFPADTKRIFVVMRCYKTNHRSDAHNQIDGICDVLQAATGFNDRYYTIYCEWDIDKDKPRIEITMSTIGVPH